MGMDDFDYWEFGWSVALKFGLVSLVVFLLVVMFDLGLIGLVFLFVLYSVIRGLLSA